MGLRRLRFAGIDVVVFIPTAVGTRLRTIGGILPDRRRGERRPAVLPSSKSESQSVQALQRRVDEIEWYHTIDLGNGVVTSGWFDLRPLLPHYPLPDRLDGMRVLDVATFDGFWAFEFERRGAAEVVALDIDSFAEVDMAPRIRRQKEPAYLARKTGEGFKVAHEALHSKVRRQVLNVYDLSPEKTGKFDLVFISDVLLHLQNPMKALANVASVTGGKAIICDVYEPALPAKLMSYESGTTHNIWWSTSFGALEQMIVDAGFSTVTLKSTFVTGYRGDRAILSHAAFEAIP